MPKSKRQSRVFTVRFTAGAYREFERAAKKNGLSVSDFARRALQRGLAIHRSVLRVGYREPGKNEK
jgi:hypothetical protein